MDATVTASPTWSGTGPGGGQLRALDRGDLQPRARVEGNGVGYGSICAAGAHRHHPALGPQRRRGPPGELLLLDPGWRRTRCTPPMFTAPCRSTAASTSSSARSTTRSTTPRGGHRGGEAGARYRDFHEASQRVCWPRVEWGLVEGPASGSWRWPSSAAGPCTAPATCSAWTSTTAPTRARVLCGLRLEPGMVLTVEPGLYFQQDDLTVPEEYRGIGVRIEDDILVTAPAAATCRRHCPALGRGRGVDGRLTG
ncbi:M24 family metallopeptidase [Streptacidiphilus sp. 4-A2]|nr:M24 family metallopeptidase [Streptacidiphilus sp. 4-A2]